MHHRPRAATALPVLFLATVSFTCHATAQDESGAETAASSPWVLVSLVSVKPEMRQEWLDLQRTEVTPALKKAGVASRAVWEPVFGDLTVYASVVPFESFAQLDGEGPLQKALEGEERMVLLQKLSKCIDGRKRYAVRARAEFRVTAGAEPAGPPAYAVLTAVVVQHGKQPEFEKLLGEEVLPALKAGGVTQLYANQTVFGGNADEWVFVSLMPQLAEIDRGPPLLRGLGRQGMQKLRAKFVGVIVSVENRILRFNTELSYDAAVPSNP